MSSEMVERIRVLGATQQGLATRRQLHDAGMSPGALRRRIGVHWEYALPGVVQLSRTTLSAAQRLVAACLLVGPDGVITGPTAAACYGLAHARPDGYVEVLVPSTRAARTVGFVRTIRTDRLSGSGRSAADGLAPLAPPARAVADACRLRRDHRYSEALVIEAVQRRTTTLAALFAELDAGPVRHSAALRSALATAATGVWSSPESELARLCGGSRLLPVGWPNPQLRTAAGRLLPTPDLWFDDVGLAVQVHSRAHHSTGPDWERTVRTDSALAEAGILRIAVTPSEIYGDGAGVLRRIERAHAMRSPADRPTVVMTPRTAALR